MIKTFIIFDEKSLSDLLKYGPIDVKNDIIIYVYQNIANPELLEHLKLVKEVLGIHSIMIDISGDLVEIIDKYTKLLRILLDNGACTYIVLSKETTCSAGLVLAAFIATLFLLSNKNYDVSEIYYIIYYDDYYLLFNNHELLGLINYLNFESIYPQKKDLLKQFINGLLLLKSPNNRKLADVLGLSEKVTSEFSKLLERLKIIEVHMRKREKMYLLNPLVRSFASTERKPYFCVYYNQYPSKIITLVNSPTMLAYVLVGFKILNIEKIYYVGNSEKEKIDKLLTITEFPKESFKYTAIDNISKYLEIEFKEAQSKRKTFEFYIEILEESKTIELLKVLIGICLKHDVNADFKVYSKHQYITFTLHQFENFFLSEIPYEEKKLLQILAKNSLKKDEKVHKHYEIAAKILDTWDSRPMPYNVLDKLLQALSEIEKYQKFTLNEIYRILCQNGISISRSKIRELLINLEHKELITIYDKKYNVAPLVKAFYQDEEKYKRIFKVLGEVAKQLCSQNHF